MNKITQQASEAFHNGQRFSSGNTTITVEKGTVSSNSTSITIVNMFLHGQLIAKKVIKDCINKPPSQKVYISLAGYPTPTTRERLNGLEGVSVYQKKGKQYLNGVEIEDNKFYTV